MSITDKQNPAGGARRDRTDDLLLAKQALSQLSYGPQAGQRRRHGWQDTFVLVGIFSRSCGAAKVWWAWEDLNFRPHAYQARALTS